MARLGSRLLDIQIDGTEYNAEVTSAKFTTDDKASGDVSFLEAREGGSKEYKLALKFFQDPSTTTLWDKVWSAAGTTVPIVVWPNGKPVGGGADATHPSFSADVVISEPSGDLLGGDAASDTTVRWVTEVSWVCLAKPVRAFA
jgi:hypothetical protein